MRQPAWLAMVAIASGCLGLASARSIRDFSMEVRRSNVVRVSRQSCDECTTLDEFYAENGLVFVLFYERSLASPQRYKTAIISGFHEACAELRFSHIVCGAVDMVDDKEYALKYIDPKTAPAHIIVRGGQPLGTPKRHLERLMQRPGDKETILWHLGDLLSAESTHLALHMSAEAKDPGTLGRLLQRHTATVVVAGSSAASAVRAAAQRLVHEGHVPNAVYAPKAKAGKGKGKPQPGSKHLFFVVASGVQTLKAYNLTESTVCSFVGDRQFSAPVEVSKKKLSSEDTAVDFLRQHISELHGAFGGEKQFRKIDLEAAATAEQGSTVPQQQQGGASGGKGKRRARRRAKSAEL